MPLLGNSGTRRAHLYYNSDRIYLVKRSTSEADDAEMTSGATTQTTNADSLLSVPGADITVREVPWHHLAAVALREALAGEMLVRGAEPSPGRGGLAAVFGADARTVAYTGVAFTDEGLPAGYATLRWTDDDVELAGLYVVPSHRDSGTSTALLAAAEAAARGLRGSRLRSASDAERRRRPCVAAG
jgi:GNAT superfamily N-acetyltransferase